MIAAITNSKQLTQQQQLRLLFSQGACWVEEAIVGCLSYLLRLWESCPSKSTSTKSTTKARGQVVVVGTVSDEDAGDGGLNEDAMDMFGSSTSMEKKKTPPPSPPAAAPQAPSSPPQFVYDEAWFAFLDGLIAKIQLVEGDLVMVERAIRTASTQCRLWGVTWNFQDQMHIKNIITRLLCHLDAIDIPQQAVFLRSQRKQFVKRIEGLIDLWKASMSSKKKKKSTTTTRRVVSSSTSSTPTKKEKRLAAKARARQWSDRTFPK